MACADDATLPGCANCTSGAQIMCPDTLESLNALCQADSTHAVCGEREAMCTATGDNLSIFCEGVTASAVSTSVPHLPPFPPTRLPNPLSRTRGSRCRAVSAVACVTCPPPAQCGRSA